MNRTTPRKLAGAAAAALLGVSLGVVGARVGVAAAQTDDCPNPVNGAQCPEAQVDRTEWHLVDIPGASLDIADSGPPICSNGLPGEWHRWEDRIPGIEPPPPSDGSTPPPGSVAWVLICPRADGQPWPSWTSAIGGSGWSDPSGPPATPPSATQIAVALWAQVQGLLVPPQISLEPAEAGDSVIHVPTFVSITNPQPPTRYITEVAGLTVWIDVLPHPTLNPGEPGAPAVSCDHDGTVYDPGAPADEQAAADGACAHAYERRTGVEGRPAAWTGNVTIDWDVSWDSNVAGEDGTLTAAPSVTAFERVVHELNTFVVEFDG
jgi:hypothetical protein